MEKRAEATVTVLRLWWRQRVYLVSFCARICLNTSLRSSYHGPVQNRCCYESNLAGPHLSPTFNPSYACPGSKVLNGNDIVEEPAQLKFLCSYTGNTLISRGGTNGKLLRTGVSYCRRSGRILYAQRSISSRLDEAEEASSNTSHGDVYIYPLSSLLY